MRPISYIAALWLLCADAASQDSGIRDITLVSCDANLPDPNAFCGSRAQKTIYPFKNEYAPGFRGTPSNIKVNGEYNHTLTWKSDGDKPVIVSWGLDNERYFWRQEIPKGENSVNFVFNDLITEFEKSNETYSGADTAYAVTSGLTIFKLLRKGEEKGEYLPSPIVLEHGTFFMLEELEGREEAVLKRDLNKKWRLGVGVGVGVGVPLLMAAAFLLGRMSKKSTAPPAYIAKE